MSRTLVYLTHWRIPSEKTMSPLIMRTCAEFAALGYRVSLWAPWRYSPQLKHVDPFTHHGIARTFLFEQKPAIDILRFFSSVGFYVLLASFNISAACALWVRVRRGEKLIVYAHDMRTVVVPALLGLPLYIEIHDYYESSLRALNRFVLRRTAGLIVTNPIKRAHIHEAYGFPEERMITQMNAVDAALFDIPLSQADARRELSLPLDRTIALYTGHLFRWKGVYTLADAARFLPESMWVYFVGGTEEDRVALKEYVAQHALPRIVFLPHQAHTRMPLFMRAADVLVLPNTATDDASKYETSPVKSFEYAASGVPIVATDLPSLRFVFSDKEVWFVPPDSPEDMARGIHAAHQSLEKEARTSSARAFARAQSWEGRARAIDALIARTLP